jgi:hypothetical protein
MPQITFDIPNDKVTRISNALPRHGYVFNPELGTTDAQQRLAFLKAYTIKFWVDLTHDAEKREAIETAQANTPPPDLTDIT